MSVMEQDPTIQNLMNDLQRLKNELEIHFKEKYNRSLPFGEMLNDRWERAKKLGWGLNTSIYDSALVFGNVKVGSDTWIGPFTVIDGSGNLEIGNHCSISSGVQIYTHDTVQWAISGGTEPYSYAPTKIGDNCYIGPNVIITKGVILGNGCVVGANSLVNRSYPKNSKIAGTPAKIIN